MDLFVKWLAAMASILLLLPAAAQQPTTNAPPTEPSVWGDRRPVVQIYLSQAHDRTRENPGGYLNRKVNLLTVAGREAFRKALLQSASQWIAGAKEVNAQGMIVWDLEGFEQPGLVPVGDPRVLPWFTPAMNEVADQFFRKFLDAGLRTGVTIRPNKVFLVPPEEVAKLGKWGCLAYDDRKDDVVWELSQRIAYAKKRWGCTIFYMDSNGYDTWASGRQQHDLLPDAMLKALHSQYPDVLIIPEQYRQGYEECSAQYLELDQGKTGTPANLREKSAGAFSVLQISGGAEDLAEANWDVVAESVKRGDALFAQGCDRSPQDERVKLLYRQAEYLKRSLPTGTDPKSPAALLKLLEDPDPALRFLAVSALDELADPRTVEPLLALLGKDKDWLVRKEAILALGRLKDPKAIEPLLALVKNTAWGHRFFALRALAEMGAQGLPAAQELAASGNKNHRADAARLLGAIADENSVPSLCELLADKAREVRMSAVAGLEKAPDPRAIAPLIRLLETETDWAIQLPAIRALGRIGDSSAREALLHFALIELPDKNAEKQVRAAANEALRMVSR